MKPRVTQTDIARVAGVHNTTVSLALRNSPAIPEATRKRIRGIAAEMGYYPDPALQALVAYRNARKPNRRQETIAYVTNGSTRWGWQLVPAHAHYHRGAERKASESGFVLEHFWLGEPGMTQRRLSSILFNRGISGVILAAHGPGNEAWTDVDWSRLSAIKLGGYPSSPALNAVSEDQGGAMRLAVRRAREAGYERLGLVLPRWWDDSTDQAWSTAFLAEQCRWSERSRVPILWHDGEPTASRGPVGPCPSGIGLSVLSAWCERHRPDVILGPGASLREELDSVGLDVPADIGLVNLALDASPTDVAGVRGNWERVGEVAMELLMARLQQNDCGLPAAPTTTLVAGTWCEGTTLRALRGATWASSAPDPDRYDDRVFTNVA